METNKKTSNYHPAPISDSVLQILERKYGIAKEELERIAKEMRFGRPRLEMHLIFLASAARKK